MNKPYKILIGAIAIFIVICILLFVSNRMRGDVIKGPGPEDNPIEGIVRGKVLLRTGDCMPKIDGGNTCKVEPISTMVYVFLPIKTDSNFLGKSIEEVSMMPKGAPLAKMKTNDKGEYSFRMPVGMYSILAEDSGKLYCNSFDDNGACIAVFSPMSIKDTDIIINHATD